MASRWACSREAACAEVIDEVIERGECDFAADIALPLPSRLICDLIGVPRADQAWVTGQALIAYGRDDPEYVPGVLDDPDRGALAVLEAAQQLAGYAQELGHGKRARPGDDLVSRLATADLNGHPLTGEQLAQWFILLVIAGTETTRQAISHGVLMLDRHPRPAGGLAAGLRPAGAHRQRGTRPLVITGHRIPPHAHPRCRPLRPAARCRGQGDAVLSLGQPRRASVPRPLPVRSQPCPQPAPRLRRTRPALLPRRAPGPGRDPGHVPGPLHPDARPGGH